jgi:hypothetical protein
VAVVVLCNRADVDPATLAARVLKRWLSRGLSRGQ